MTEELKQKAKDFIYRIDKESDGMWLNNYYLSDLLVMFVTEATKELQEENNELKGKLMLSDMVLADKTKRIKELEDKLMDKVCLESLDIVSAKIKDLEKENAELKCECRRCVYSDSPCILSDYGKDRNGICDHFKDVFDEIVELKDNFKIAKDNEYEYSSLLTKAKELLNEFMRINKASDEDFEHDYSELIGETEQFLNGEGCPDYFCEDCTKDCGIKKLGLVEK